MLCFYLYLYFHLLYCHEEFDRDIKIDMNDFFFSRALTTMDSDEVCMQSNQNISLLIRFLQINYLNQELITFLWLVIFHVAVSVGSNYVLTVALCIGKIMAVFSSKNFYLLLFTFHTLHVPRKFVYFVIKILILHSGLVILVES